MKPTLLLAIVLAGAAAARTLVASPAPEPTVTFYGDGTLKSSVVFVDGRREGPAEQFWPDGSPRSSGCYRDGARDGSWTFWLEDGSVDADRSGRYAADVRLEEPSGRD